MARVDFNYESAIREGFPNVCVCCGEIPTTTIRHEFRNANAHIGPPPLEPIGAIEPLIHWAKLPTVRLELPVCERHRNHFRKRLIIHILAGIAPAVSLGLIFVLSLFMGEKVFKELNVIEQVVAIVSALALLVSVVWMLLVLLTWHRFTVHAVKISGQRIRLRGVSQAFADAIIVKYMVRKSQEPGWEREHSEWNPIKG